MYSRLAVVATSCELSDDRYCSALHDFQMTLESAMVIVKSPARMLKQMSQKLKTKTGAGENHVPEEA